MQNNFSSRPGRPRLRRVICWRHQKRVFKPQGKRMSSLLTISLSLEELEAIRLKNIVGLDQGESAKKMKTSQSTFQRILFSAHKKMSDALINGKAIIVENK